MATIYKATELYMLQDTSDDHKETWLFLERRINDALQIRAMLPTSVKPDETLHRVTETATAVFVTVSLIILFLFLHPIDIIYKFSVSGT